MYRASIGDHTEMGRVLATNRKAQLTGWYFLGYTARRMAIFAQVYSIKIKSCAYLFISHLFI
jgi:hypothetical protein